MLCHLQGWFTLEQHDNRLCILVWYKLIWWSNIMLMWNIKRSLNWAVKQFQEDWPICISAIRQCSFKPVVTTVWDCCHIQETQKTLHSTSIKRTQNTQMHWLILTENRDTDSVNMQNLNLGLVTWKLQVWQVKGKKQQLLNLWNRAETPEVKYTMLILMYFPHG